MKCPHCLVMFHPQWTTSFLVSLEKSGYNWGSSVAICPNCKEPIVRLGRISSLVSVNGQPKYHLLEDQSFLVYPKFPIRGPISAAIPSKLSMDYLEACNVLVISPKASAALSRRVLQHILSDNGYTGRDLASQIRDVLSESDPRKALPMGVRETVDVVRSFGNFAAHPIQDKTRLQGVIEVEEHEAEWCLEIIEALFDHYYARPAESNERLAELNKKLKDAGKPPARSQ